MKIYENGKFREMTEKEIQEIVNYIPEEDKGFHLFSKNLEVIILKGIINFLWDYYKFF